MFLFALRVEYDYIKGKNMNFIGSNEVNLIKINFYENYFGKDQKNEKIFFNNHLYYKRGQTSPKGIINS